MHELEIINDVGMGMEISLVHTLVSNQYTPESINEPCSGLVILTLITSLLLKQQTQPGTPRDNKKCQFFGRTYIVKVKIVRFFVSLLQQQATYMLEEVGRLVSRDFPSFCHALKL